MKKTIILVFCILVMGNQILAESQDSKELKIEKQNNHKISLEYAPYFSFSAGYGYRLFDTLYFGLGFGLGPKKYFGDPVLGPELAKFDLILEYIISNFIFQLTYHQSYFLSSDVNFCIPIPDSCGAAPNPENRLYGNSIGVLLNLLWGKIIWNGVKIEIGISLVVGDLYYKKEATEIIILENGPVEFPKLEKTSTPMFQISLPFIRYSWYF